MRNDFNEYQSKNQWVEVVTKIQQGVDSYLAIHNRESDQYISARDHKSHHGAYGIVRAKHCKRAASCLAY